VLICCGFQIIVAMGKVNCNEVRLLSLSLPIPDQRQVLQAFTGFKNAACFRLLSERKSGFCVGPFLIILLFVPIHFTI
jgi:hypothetical protein